MHQTDTARGHDLAVLGAAGHDAARWRCHWKVEKYEAFGPTEEQDVLEGLALAGNPVARRGYADWLARGGASADIVGRLRAGDVDFLRGRAWREHGRWGRRYDCVVGRGNLLLTAGVTLLWNKLIGGAGQVYDNSNAYIGVGDSNTAEGAAQTDLQAATNKLRKAMDATYPSVATNVLTFKSTFATSDANFQWREWGTFNASSAGTMLQRKVQEIGTKASGAAWAFTVTVTLS